MYRYSNGQISLADFKQPVGMKLKESNRWVKKAQTIPYPQDVSLLNEARENAEKLLVVLHDSADGKKPRTYRKHTAKMTCKAIGKQLAYLILTDSGMNLQPPGRASGANKNSAYRPKTGKRFAI